MGWVNFFAALGLFFVFEGIIPFLSPNRHRLMCMKLVMMREKQIRMFGLVSMVIGVIILLVAKQL